MAWRLFILFALAPGCHSEAAPAAPLTVTIAPDENDTRPDDDCEVQRVALFVRVGPSVNMGRRGEARPVLLRLYHLSRLTAFDGASFVDLTGGRDEATLGDERLHTDEVVVLPGELVEVNFERVPEADFLAAVAFFDHPGTTGWSATHHLPPAWAPCVAALHISIDGEELRVPSPPARLDVDRRILIPGGRLPQSSALPPLD